MVTLWCLEGRNPSLISVNIHNQILALQYVYTPSFKRFKLTSVLSIIVLYSFWPKQKMKSDQNMIVIKTLGTRIQILGYTFSSIKILSYGLKKIKKLLYSKYILRRHTSHKLIILQTVNKQDTFSSTFISGPSRLSQHSGTYWREYGLLDRITFNCGLNLKVGHYYDLKYLSKA
jgi:hypothetical protein